MIYNDWRWKISATEVDSCCEFGVKDECISCEFNHFCNEKWSQGTPEGATFEDEPELKI